MKKQIPCVILSGGKSSRMGSPKALLPFGTARMIDHVAARIRPTVSGISVNANDQSILLPGSETFPDVFPDYPGPLAGIHAALLETRARCPDQTHVLILPVDAPFFPKDIIARLLDVLAGPDDIALTASCGRKHPVLGLWPISLASRLGEWLKNPPTLKVRIFLDGLPVRWVEFPMMITVSGPVDPFFNINSPDDLEFATAHVGEMME
jgi:molybdopterin-guanine dinucleotide biosynthesis protein A